MQPYVGEIRMFGGNFAPVGWAFCNGQTLAIAENETLFNLIGTTYGGDGQTTFNLPDLQGRIPIHQGTGPAGVPHTLGESLGVEQVTLTTAEFPAHSHPVISSNAATLGDPLQAYLGAPSVAKIYGPDASISQIAMSPAAMPTRGGSHPHDNVMPFLCVNFIISLFGIFPSQF
jgi:microcystin-dependent protein